MLLSDPPPTIGVKAIDVPQETEDFLLLQWR